jgi:hypothetical protein
MIDYKTCSQCNNIKSPSDFRIKRSICKSCESLNAQKYNLSHPEQHKKSVFKYKKKWRKANKNKINSQYRDRLKSDPIFKLRKNCNRSINHILKQNNSSKNNNSFLSFLPYSIDELKSHLEKQFDFNMSWNNYGTYWELDHITPQSDLPYSSMTDDNFKRCWNLSNLRPLTVKENRSDGATRKRHNKKI